MAKRSPSETPLMRQYLDIKASYPDAILFFRCGDFYEMFFDDAVKSAELLDIALTSRNKQSEEAVPMAGVPHHAARTYIAKLTELGQKVVLCEQIEDAKLAKGLVRRKVMQVVTPGVVLDDEVLDPKTARYLAAVTCDGSNRFGLAYLDASTGEFSATELTSIDALITELARVQPREILSGEAELAPDGPLAPVKQRFAASYGAIEPLPWLAAKDLVEHAVASSVEELGLKEHGLALRAAGDVVSYARATQPAGNLPISRLYVYDPAQTLVLDETAVSNLELVSTMVGGKKAGSLLSVLDQTCTAPGGRLLRRWMLYPLAEIVPIRRRQDAVEYFVERPHLRSDIRTELKQIHDLERLSGRISLGVATPRDLGRLRDSLRRLPSVAALLRDSARGDAGGLDFPEMLRLPDQDLAPLGELCEVLTLALVDEPPPVARDGGYIRAGYDALCDEHRHLTTGGKDAILAIENHERERTGIPSLKVKYNRVFGYYIEVTRSHLSRVPGDYVRKQTIATAERFVTTELAELETKVLNAQDNLLAREEELFLALRERAAKLGTTITAVGQILATIDGCAALAEVAHKQGYVRPVVDDSECIDIAEGRHPVVERVVPAGAYVPNDCRMDPAKEQILLITGPNMAGKSTYMRQVAHIVLLAQMGSFVPAARARVGLVDRIFTRVGAADNLARGESTFMVEMRETAAILKGATRRSLVVLDEVGRGTSTFDGVSIAWAVAEYLHDAIGARTLFATHYHELCMLAETRPRVRNVSVAVKEHGGEIVFLRQVVEGGASRSYGIDVARLAGLPRSVIGRSRQILQQLEGGARLGQSNQLSLFAAMQVAPPPPENDRLSELLSTLRSVDPHNTTPLDALRILAELHQMVR